MAARVAGLGLALACGPACALAGEPVDYVAVGETFEGSRAAASGESKGLVLVIHDCDGLTQYEIQIYSGAPHGFTHFGSDRYQKRADDLSWDAFSDFLAETLTK
jgi:dienelactone hydrolase